MSQHVPRQFFPASDRPELTVDMTLRQNASIYATEAQAKRFETILKDDPDVDHFSTYVGRGAIRFILTFNVQLANPFFAQFVIVAKNLEARAPATAAAPPPASPSMRATCASSARGTASSSASKPDAIRHRRRSSCFP